MRTATPAVCLTLWLTVRLFPEPTLRDFTTPVKVLAAFDPGSVWAHLVLHISHIAQRYLLSPPESVEQYGTDQLVYRCHVQPVILFVYFFIS